MSTAPSRSVAHAPPVDSHIFKNMWVVQIILDVNEYDQNTFM